MKNKVQNYINQIASHIVADERMKERIVKDLYSHMSEACRSKDVDSVINSMGDPEEVAKEFMDTIYEDKNEVIEKLIQERFRTQKLIEANTYEYKSKTKLFGLPLVHIKFRKSRGFRKPTVAKGIIAVGEVSVGLISVGAIALGGISLGAVSLGLLALGALAFGGIAFGSVAIGLFAIGAVAVGLGAIGAVAVGKIALGAYANGLVAIGGKAVGQFIISGNQTGGNYSLSSVGHLAPEQISSLIRSAYPDMSEWIIRIFTFFAP